MERVPVLALAALLVLVGVWVFKGAERHAANARARYLKAPWFVQHYPFSNMVLRPWFPTYLRYMSVYIWIMAAILVWVAFKMSTSD